MISVEDQAKYITSYVLANALQSYLEDPTSGSSAYNREQIQREILMQQLTSLELASEASFGVVALNDEQQASSDLKNGAANEEKCFGMNKKPKSKMVTTLQPSPEEPYKEIVSETSSEGDPLNVSENMLVINSNNDLPHAICSAVQGKGENEKRIDESREGAEPRDDTRVDCGKETNFHTGDKAPESDNWKRKVVDTSRLPKASQAPLDKKASVLNEGKLAEISDTQRFKRETFDKTLSDSDTYFTNSRRNTYCKTSTTNSPAFERHRGQYFKHIPQRDKFMRHRSVPTFLNQVYSGTLNDNKSTCSGHREMTDSFKPRDENSAKTNSNSADKSIHKVVEYETKKAEECGNDSDTMKTDEKQEDLVNEEKGVVSNKLPALVLPAPACDMREHSSPSSHEAKDDHIESCTKSTLKTPVSRAERPASVAEGEASAGINISHTRSKSFTDGATDKADKVLYDKVFKVWSIDKIIDIWMKKSQVIRGGKSGAGSSEVMLRTQNILNEMSYEHGKSQNDMLAATNIQTLRKAPCLETLDVCEATEDRIREMVNKWRRKTNSGGLGDWSHEESMGNTTMRKAGMGMSQGSEQSNRYQEISSESVKNLVLKRYLTDIKSQLGLSPLPRSANNDKVVPQTTRCTKLPKKSRSDSNILVDTPDDCSSLSLDKKLSLELEEKLQFKVIHRTQSDVLKKISLPVSLILAEMPVTHEIVTEEWQSSNEESATTPTEICNESRRLSTLLSGVSPISDNVFFTPRSSLDGQASYTRRISLAVHKEDRGALQNFNVAGEIGNSCSDDQQTNEMVETLEIPAYTISKTLAITIIKDKVSKSENHGALQDNSSIPTAMTDIKETSTNISYSTHYPNAFQQTQSKREITRDDAFRGTHCVSCDSQMASDMPDVIPSFKQISKFTEITTAIEEKTQEINSQPKTANSENCSEIQRLVGKAITLDSDMPTYDVKQISLSDLTSLRDGFDVPTTENCEVNVLQGSLSEGLGKLSSLNADVGKQSDLSVTACSEEILSGAVGVTCGQTGVTSAHLVTSEEATKVQTTGVLQELTRPQHPRVHLLKRENSEPAECPAPNLREQRKSQQSIWSPKSSPTHRTSLNTCLETPHSPTHAQFKSQQPPPLPQGNQQQPKIPQRQTQIKPAETGGCQFHVSPQRPGERSSPTAKRLCQSTLASQHTGSGHLSQQYLLPPQRHKKIEPKKEQRPRSTSPRTLRPHYQHESPPQPQSLVLPRLFKPITPAPQLTELHRHSLRTKSLPPLPQQGLVPLTQLPILQRCLTTATGSMPNKRNTPLVGTAGGEGMQPGTDTSLTSLMCCFPCLQCRRGEDRPELERLTSPVVIEQALVSDDNSSGESN